MGGKGVKTFDITDEAGYLTNIICLKEGDKDLILIGKNNNIRLGLNDFPIMGRATIGIKLLNHRITNLFNYKKV